MISDAMSPSYHDVMEVYKRPMSVRYIPNIFASLIVLLISFIAAPANANHLPVMYVQVPQWADCLLYTSPSPRDEKVSRMPSAA